ncbi:hypothetical protein [Nonomuraea jabiensis]|uniref:hypothetical protein n=1 Tax=Nonomuraea jabiensis TaxID=882448 RepID=UPI003D72935F
MTVEEPPDFGPDFCWSCYKDEPIPEGGAYQVCFECSHVYVTWEDLVDTYNVRTLATNKAHPEFAPLALLVSSPESAERIFHCPLCLHDF